MEIYWDAGIILFHFSKETAGYHGVNLRQACTDLGVPTSPTMVPSSLLLLLKSIKSPLLNINDINSIALCKPQYCSVDILEIAFSAIIQTQQIPSHNSIWWNSCCCC